MKSAATRAVYENYSEKRSHLFRRKKHEFVKAECEIEMQGSRKDARKFFQMIKDSSLELLSARTKMADR